MIADGLGHGQGAEEVSRAAVDYVAGHLSEPPPDIFSGCDVALRQTRGVIMSIAVIDEGAGTLTYAGVGDTHSRIVGHEPRHMLKTFGIVGAGYKKLLPETFPIATGDLVIMATDGIKEQFSVSNYDETVRSNVRMLAERILQDWGRENDEAAVLVFRHVDEKT